MEYYIGVGTSDDVSKCVKEATSKLRNPNLILFFSPVKHFQEYAEQLHNSFPNSITMGATTIASLTRQGAEKKNLMVVGFEDGLICSANILEDVDRYPVKYVERVEKCVEEVKECRDTICLEFTTAFLCAEESVLSALNSVLYKTGIPVFGGTAGNLADGLTTTLVALNGVVKENGCVFAIIHNKSGAIKIYRENIYYPRTGNVLTVTKADSWNRRVMEFNGQPATKVYARELGISEDQIDKYRDSNPIGRIVGNEMYVTANSEKRGTDMIFHSRIYKNSKVVVLEPDDYRKIIKQTKEKIKNESPNPKFAIVCHCLARTIWFEKEGYLNQYARELAEALGDYIGFSGYGEQKGDHHFNQTMTTAVFE
ncbi:MAG: hypothetical protein IKL07_06405 [Clostridium sp.]|nr:hypothetical protein [Clostridium sp.]